MLKLIRFLVMLSSVACMVNGTTLCVRAAIELYKALPPNQNPVSLSYCLCMIIGSGLVACGVDALNEILRIEIVPEEEGEDE